MRPRVRKFSRRSLWVVLALTVGAFLVGLAMGVQWLTFTRSPLPEALDALVSDGVVTVTQGAWLTFSPKGDTPKLGFIFYPGGRNDFRGYAPLMRAIALQGYYVVVPEMPFNIAVFGTNAADEIIASNPDIVHWVIGGHSVGGAMAASYADNHRADIDGLAIWASYPADNVDLSHMTIPVISIYGSRELRVNDASVAERKHLLPGTTRYFRIEGGDHHQFGSYEITPEEHRATTSRDMQHQEILQATLELLDTVADTK